MSYNPAPALPSVPYPWTTEWSPEWTTVFFRNTETGETRWTHPTEQAANQYQEGEFIPLQNSSIYDTPAASYAGPAGQTSRGEASSFFGGAAPQYHQPPQGQQQGYQSSPSDGGAPGEPGERGLGKVVVGGAVLYMGYKMYKSWKKDHQKPPFQQGPPGQFKSSVPAQQHSHSPQPQAGSYGTSSYASPGFQQPQSSYSLAPPMQSIYSQPASSYGSGPPPYAPPIFSKDIAPPSFNGQPIDNTYQSYPQQQEGYQSNTSQPFPQAQPYYDQSSMPNPTWQSQPYPPSQDSWQQSPPHHAQGGWGDPRF